MRDFEPAKVTRPAADSSDCERARHEKSRGRRTEPGLAAKLSNWECEGQESLFGDGELLTPEVREYRDQQAR